MTLPVVGAALGVGDISTFRDWLFEKDRNLELQSFFDPELLARDDWRDLAEEATRQLDGYQGRLGVHGPFWGFGLSAPDPDFRRLAEHRLMQGLDICAAVSATQMVIHSPFTTWDGNHLDLQPGSRERKIEAVHDTLGQVVRRAEDQGVTLVLENIEDTDPMDRVRLAESFASASVRVSLDTGHAAYAHCRTGAPPVDAHIYAAGTLLHHVHLQDADGHADRHWSIGEGSVPWHAVFRALANVTERPRLVLELQDASNIPASMRFLSEAGLAQ